ncbi:hypothetical protein BH10PSE3_BH10PSE3_04080 [soil metagenome]
MTRIIRIEPFGQDWRVRYEQLGDDMMFHSGAAAEAAARVLADASAKRGERAEVQIHLRDGSLARLTSAYASAAGFSPSAPAPAQP